jgi:opacity protein-like surface antigen
MKSLVLVAALLAGGMTAPAAAQPATPPGDGVTAQGTDPEGQACTPPGYNTGSGGYPPCGATNAPPQSSPTPPACSRTVTDHCVQTYERGVRRPG